MVLITKDFMSRPKVFNYDKEKEDGPFQPPNGAAFATVTPNDDARSDYHFNRLNDLVSYLDIKH